MAPHHLEAMIAGSSASHIIIDEIQKIPKLLDEVHRLIEKPENKIQILTRGSISRKRFGLST